MAFNANDFRQSFNNGTNNTPLSLTASPAYFEVEFGGMPGCLMRSDMRWSTAKKLDKAARSIKHRAKAADLPARQMVSVQRAFNGPHKLVPYSSIYSTSIIEFIETADFDIRTLFDTWQGMIEGNQRDYVSEYYDEIILPELIVRAFDKSGKAKQEWIFYNVFPVSVNPSQLNWDSKSSYITVPIELSYYRWTYKTL